MSSAGPMESNVQGETEGIESATNGVSSDPTPVGHPTKELELEPASQTTAAEDERKYPQGTKFYVIFVSACLVLILAEMDFSIVAVAVPSITNTYHTVADIGWYSSAFRLSMCSFQFLFGKLYKLFSFKKIFMGCVGIFLLASIVCSFAPTSLSFVIGRAIAGLASGGIVAGIFTLLVYCLPLRKRPLYTSFAGAIEGVSIIGAPVIGGFLVEVDWRWCFIINIPLSVIALVLLAIFLEDFKPSARQSWRQCVKELDLLGNLVLIPSLTCLFMALGWAGTRYEWSSPTIIALFCVFFFLLIVFAIDQWAKQDAATLPPRILKNRSILSGFLFSLCCSSTLNVVEYYLPIWFQAVREYSPSTSGLLMIPGVVGYMVAFLLQGSGVNVIGYYVPFMLAGSILMPLFAGLMTTLTVDTSIVKVLVLFAFFGFGSGIAFQSPQVAVQHSLPESDANMGLAIIVFAQSFGPSISIAVAQTIFTDRLSANLRDVGSGLNATTIENMGLSDLKNRIRPDRLHDVLLGLDRSVVQTWYLAVGLACVTMIGSATMEWRRVRPKSN